MKTLVVGATGVLGRQLIPRLVEQGYPVRAIIRNQKHEKALQAIDVETISGDILDKDSLRKAAEGCEAAVHIATAIPKSGSQDWSLNDRIRREGTHNFLEACEECGVRQYIQQSIALLYGENGQGIVDESMPIRPTAITQSAADMEELVRHSRLDWCILRGGLFYGPGTGREDSWREAAHQGKLRLPDNGSDLISLVHVVDMARAVTATLENAPANSLFNIMDDYPVNYRALFNYISAQLDLDMPREDGPRFLPSLGCSNEKAKRELGWQPVYRSYLSGLA
jgi:nucleoside-diphosphate-sugar epimerase